MQQGRARAGPCIDGTCSAPGPDTFGLQGLYNKIINNTQDLTKEDVLSKVVDDFQSTFCTDPVFIPKQKVPASLTGKLWRCWL